MASSVATSSSSDASSSSSTLLSSVATPSSSSPSIDDLSAAFVQSFYEALATHPESLYAFYHENATSVRYVDDRRPHHHLDANGVADNESAATEAGGDGDGEGAGGAVSSWSSVNCVHGQIEIDRVAGLISRCRVRVDTLNSTQDRNTNTVHILVTGVLLRGRTPRSFSHSFILLNDGEAYSISSDILRLYPLHAAHHLASSTPSSAVAAVGIISNPSSLVDASPAAVGAAADTNAVTPSSAVPSTPLNVPKSPAAEPLALPSTPSIKADVHENEHDHEHLQATPSSERRGKKRHEPATDAELAAAGIEEEPTVIDVERQILPSGSDLESPKPISNGVDAASAIVEDVSKPTPSAVLEPVVVVSAVSNHNTAAVSAAAAPVVTHVSSAKPAEPVHVPVKPSSWASLIANKTAQQASVSAAPVSAAATAVPSTTSSSASTPSSNSISSSPSEPLQQTLVSVSNLPTNVSRPDIHAFFSRFGPVQQIHFNDGTPSEATVHFVHSHDAIKVLQFQTQSLLLGGNQLNITPLIVSVPPSDHHHRQNGNPHVFRSGRAGGRPRPPPRDSPKSSSNNPTNTNNDGVDADGFVTQGRRRKNNNNSSNTEDQRGSGRPTRGDFGRGPARPRPATSSAPKH